MRIRPDRLGCFAAVNPAHDRQVSSVPTKRDLERQPARRAIHEVPFCASPSFGKITLGRQFEIVFGDWLSGGIGDPKRIQTEYTDPEFPTAANQIDRRRRLE
jgi:hypothetical protein